MAAMRLSVLMLCCVLAACTTLRPIASGVPIEVGDRVVVTTRDGGRLAFEVTAVDTETIRGADASVARGDITTLERREFSAGRTAGAALGVFAFIYAWAILLVNSETR
jgi:hypothetical protein